MSIATSTLPPSLWAATAPAAPPTPPLAGSRRADVLIVGAGFTGLSAALHLAEAGAKVCVLEAHEPGWGASGRNGGQVNPTLKHDPDELVRLYGAARAEPLIDAVSRSADLVFELIERHGIDCQPVRKGWLQVAYSQQHIAAMHARAEQWARRGVATQMLDRAEVAARLGTDAFAGGWLDGRAGGIQPLAYTRGLVRAAQAAGASVHGGSAVTALERRGTQWHATTASGASVVADQVLIATNGYTGGLWPGLSRTVLAANSFIVATAPLQGAAAHAILPGGETASTSQRLLLYFRKDAQGRLLMGGRGHFADPAGRPTSRTSSARSPCCTRSSGRSATSTAGPAASPSRATSCRMCTRPRRASRSRWATTGAASRWPPAWAGTWRRGCCSRGRISRTR